ncbi:hypothetical protein TBLA_0C02040 [Henningerozyma blattae CBS 6284]|uniref:TFIIE beta domain-containing protein n=1 Tax=Henningerozyma blattae (strain ATCC 34711 / CBS 6284 / DSM 70876 / NBRC 10599 / NRRL Y-10934 / UCD 77-7) TaxID=1071380 RepID=I2H0W4_HENB6|nr:hypothetical protein TBLA_0C02040 [Tetrapisispora blattae CBS 6284]CCH60016.1 hypothetical protein TBLA_0C02040 [Tetrapisispora blattae CBS 6284]
MSNNDPLLANLNAFKSKVKSAPIIPLKRSNSNLNSTSSSANTSPKKNKKVSNPNSNKSSPSKKKQKSNNINSTSKNNLDQSLENDSQSKIKTENGINEDEDEEEEEEEEEDEEDDDDESIKKVRPGSIAAQALQIGQNNISKSHDSSKLLWATEYIQKKGKPVLLNELTDYISIKKDDKIIDLLKKLEKIHFDPKKNSFKYISTYDVHSPQELLNLLRKQVTFKGISCKELKDGWPQCDETINSLEEDSKILVLRTKKDKTPRYVWYNNGGDLHRIDEDFINMWENVQLPQFAELPRKLQELGLKPASVDPATIKRSTKTVEVKKKKQRRGKITNTHMTGILKDYSNRV